MRWLLIALFLSGCNSLEFKNLAKTGATTAITYSVAGPIPAVLNLGTSIVLDEVLPEDNTIKEVKTTKQLIAYSFDRTLEYSLYGVIAFLLFTNVITPYFIQRRAIRRKKYHL